MAWRPIHTRGKFQLVTHTRAWEPNETDKTAIQFHVGTDTNRIPVRWYGGTVVRWYGGTVPVSWYRYRPNRGTVPVIPLVQRFGTVPVPPGIPLPVVPLGTVPVASWELVMLTIIVYESVPTFEEFAMRQHIIHYCANMLQHRGRNFLTRYVCYTM